MAPEAASSYLFPLLAGWQDAAHILFTSRWVSAAEAVELGLAWRLCPAEDLMRDTMAVAGEIAAMPVASLVATKRVMKAARSDEVADARRREDEEFSTLVGAPANIEALTAFIESVTPTSAVCRRAGLDARSAGWRRGGVSRIGWASSQGRGGPGKKAFVRRM